jgi:hypothetical protein
MSGYQPSEVFAVLLEQLDGSRLKLATKSNYISFFTDWRRKIPPIWRGSSFAKTLIRIVSLFRIFSGSLIWLGFSDGFLRRPG